MGYGQEAPITVLTSAARTTAQTSSAFLLPGGLTGNGRGKVRGLLFVIDCTAITSTPILTFTVQSSSGADDAWATVLASAALAMTASSSNYLIIHPSIPNARANVSSVGPLETRWRLTVGVADADSCTYSVTAFPLG